MAPVRALAAVLLLLEGVHGGDVVIKGLPRSQQASYLALQSQNEFRCKDDASTIIAFSRVNDNFCDCPDGSDEPGTSACSSGRFYCRNKGHVGAYIPSSRVEDGICDCCDGSDESQAGLCANTCEALSAETRAARAAEIRKLEMGAAKKKTYVEQAVKALEDINKELEESKGSIEGKKTALQEAQDKKAKAEEVEKAEKDALITSRLQGLKDSLGVAGMNVEAKTALYENIKTRYGTIVKKLTEELKSELGLDVPPPTPPPPSEEEEPKEPSVDVEDAAHDPHDDEAYMDSYGDDDGMGMMDDVEGEHEHEGDVEGVEEQHTGPPPLDEAAVAALEQAEVGVEDGTEEAKALRSEVRQLESEVRDAERKIEDLEKGAKDFYGAQGELYPLKGKCFSKTVNQYVYEICPYDTAKQKEGGSSVSLGRWNRAEATEDGGFVFYFTGGQRCWNGPERSLTATVTCGVEEEVLMVDEPSMCEYSMEFATPAACSVAHANKLKLDLEDADDEDAEGAGRSEL